MIQIKNLTKAYGDTVVLYDVTYTFPQTGLVCLTGASGGGKTTLLNLLAGFDSDYAGEITAGGVLLSDMDTDALCAYRRDNIGFVFQNYHLLSGYTALENVLLAAELLGGELDSHKQKAMELLRRLGLEGKADQQVETLSGGQKQRVAIARAMMGAPQILFADEPTGALDRKTSTEIMELLQELAADRLVVVITHDAKIAAFANERIQISGQKIQVEQEAAPNQMLSNQTPPGALHLGQTAAWSPFSRSFKNYKVHLGRYLAVSVAVSIGLLAFLFSLSFGNVMEGAIADFEEKNTAFQSGYLRGADDGSILSHLNTNERIETAYYQYHLTDVSLALGEKTVDMAEKFPGSKATESLSYGVMPRQGLGEISLSPSVAKKLNEDIQSLLGKEVTLRHNGQVYTLTISGIFNAEYDDFFVSTDVEQQLYRGLYEQKNYSITYEVKTFADVVAVSNTLKLAGLEPQTAAREVAALQNTFNRLNRLFLILSLLVLAIGLLLCAVLLFKLQSSRYHEVGLLAALGYGKGQISAMILVENLLLCVLATAINLVLLVCILGICAIVQLPFSVRGVQVLLSAAGTFALILILSALASRKLICTEAAEALRK